MRDNLLKHLNAVNDSIKYIYDLHSHKGLSMINSCHDNNSQELCVNSFHKMHRKMFLFLYIISMQDETRV